MSWGEHGHSKPLGELRAGVVERLRARRSEINGAIFVRVRDRVLDPAGSGDTEYLEGLHAAVVAAVDFILAGVERAGERSEAIPPVVIAQARRAAQVGVGLDTVLRRCIAGHALLDDFLMQEADHGDLVGQRAALRGMLDTSASLLDRLISSVTGAYMEEAERAAGQRARMLDAIVEVVAERGFAGASVELVAERAGVCSRTFYECFEDLEDCFTVVLDESTQPVIELICSAFEGRETWLDGVRSALASLLVFLDSERMLARVWLVESLAAGPRALACRERKMGVVLSSIVAPWSVTDAASVPPLALEGAFASVLGVIVRRLIADSKEPLIEILGPLMGLAVAPFLDQREVAREVKRAAELARAIQAGSPNWTRPARAAQPSGEPDIEPDAALPAMLGNPSARRARECLLFLAEQGGRGLYPSNREIAAGIGVTHQSQISRLLAYLLKEDLVAKRSEGPGKRNAWLLTPRGEALSQALPELQDQPPAD